ncbi:MAG: ATP-grasp domain-containing protein [Candidatus Moranbacteria bacterium]|nr:ATP-grasp domain-containing protein [Candidatus Moranbacteria bacterium]
MDIRLDEKAIHERIHHGGFRSFLLSAIRHGVEVDLLPSEGKKHLIRLRHGKNLFFISGSNAPVWKRMTNLTRDKAITKRILNEIDIEVPKGFIASSTDESVRLMQETGLRYPIVLKPTHGSMSRGMTTDIRDENGLRQAVESFTQSKQEFGFKRDTFLVEEMFIGREYRFLVFKDDVIACAEKIPASVTGDGTSSIQELVDRFNDSRTPGYKLRLDEVALKTLERASLSTDSIIEKDRVIRLRNNVNMTDGGRAINSIDRMHPSFRDVCRRSSEIAGLEFVGIDILVRDIENKAEPGNYVVLEMNNNPYYNMHEEPLIENGSTDISLILLRSIFPGIGK